MRARPADAEYMSAESYGALVAEFDAFKRAVVADGSARETEPCLEGPEFGGMNGELTSFALASNWSFGRVEAWEFVHTVRIADEAAGVIRNLSIVAHDGTLCALPGV